MNSLTMMIEWYLIFDIELLNNNKIVKDFDFYMFCKNPLFKNAFICQSCSYVHIDP
jgi:hypothetical protein